jgi:hypothetical protein
VRGRQPGRLPPAGLGPGGGHGVVIDAPLPPLHRTPDLLRNLGGYWGICLNCSAQSCAPENLAALYLVVSIRT